MPDITITINALVKDAVDGIKDVSSAMDDQKVTSLQLAQAQRKLEDSLDNLIQAQIKLEQNTDPGKQRELEDAVIDAGVAAQKHQKQVDGLAKEYTQLNTETKSAEMSLADIKAGVDMAGQVVEKVGRVLDATVIKAADWGDSMGDMAQLTGATVRETSTMAATFELMGVEIGTLESAMKTMTKQGLQLNLETLKKLSAEYQAIQDPVEKNEFLFKKFGKAGLEMAEIMGKDSDELERLGKAAQFSGKVIGEDAAEAAEEFNIQLAILKQRGEGAAITVGNALIPTLNDAVEGGENWVKVWGAVNLLVQKNTGLITEEQAALRAAALAAGDLSAVYTEQFDPAILATVDAHERLHEVIVPAIDSMALLEEEARQWTEAGNAATVASDALKAAQGNLNGVWGDAYAAVSNLTLAEEERQRIEDALAIASGKLTAEDILRREAVETLTARYDNGLITQQQYIDQLTNLSTGALTAKEAVYGVKQAIDSLQDRTVNVSYQIQSFGAEPPGGVGNSSNAYSGGADTGGTYGGAYSHGTGGNWLTVPSGYPNDSYPIRLESGEKFMVARAGESTSNYGGVTINVSGAGNPQAVAAAVKAELDRMGRSADSRMRTR